MMIGRTIGVMLAVGCGGGGGGGGAKPTAPAEVASIFDDHVARGGDTFPVPELDGEVTCYGGELVGALGPGTIETYFRRGIDASSGTIITDLVTLFRDNPQVYRYAYTIAPGEGEAPRELTEVNQQFAGKAIVGDDYVAYMLELKDSGAFLFQHDQVVDSGLQQQSIVFLPPFADRFAIRTRLIATIEDTKALVDDMNAVIRAETASLEERSAALRQLTAEVERDTAAGERTDVVAPEDPTTLADLMQISRADLSVIPAARCAEMFATFPTL